MREDTHEIKTTEYMDGGISAAESGDTDSWSEKYNRRTAPAASAVAVRQKGKAVVLLLVFAVLAAIAVLIATQTGYAIYMNGESLGSAKDIAEVEAAVQSAESQASRILGYDYSIRDSIELEANPAGAAVEKTGGMELENAILENIQGIAKLYTLKLDGEIAAACADVATIDDALNALLDRYTNERTVNVSFVQKVTISLEYVNEEFLRDREELIAALDPQNPDSPLSIVSTERVTTPVTVPFEHVELHDKTVYEGTDTLLTAGEDGISNVTEQVRYMNGVEQERVAVATEVVKKPVREVMVIGAKYRPYYASYGEYIWPADGILTSHFGYRSTDIGSSDHKGIDIAGSSGQDIYAADGGEVIYADWLEGYGYLVKIRHDNGDVTYYGHCSELLVSEGDLVGRGQLVAYMGSTGVASGDHLHFEVRRGDEPVDPLELLPEQE